MQTTGTKVKDIDKTVILSSDQAKFLIEVINQVQLKLTYDQWHNVAENLHLWSARAAEAQFEYLLDIIKGIEKPKRRKKGDFEDSDEDSRPEWYKYLKKPHITKTPHGNFNLDGADGDFEEAEKRMSIDELLLVERVKKR